jgi:hypothetical protein
MAFNAKSVLFDGVDEYVQCGATNRTTFQEVTVSAWVKPSAIGSNMFIVDESGSAGYGGGISLYVTASGTVKFWGQDATPFVCESTTVLQVGTWYHLAGTMDAYNNRIYVDGDLEDTAGKGADPRSVKNLRIGDSQQFGGKFAGNIDEVLIFNAALSDDDISDIHNGGEPKNESSRPDLAFWWRMGDDDTFPTLTDNEGSLDGTMTNMESGDIEEDVTTGTFPIWQGDVSNLWNVAGNWSTDSVPTSTTPAVFDGDVSDVDCTVDVAIDVLNVSMRNGYSGTITNATYSVTLVGTWTQDAGTYTGGSGAFISDILRITGGTFTMTTGDFTSYTDKSGGGIGLNVAQTDPQYVTEAGGGNYHEATVGEVQSGVEFGNLSGLTGTLNNTDPGVGNVVKDITWYLNSVLKTGTFDEAARNEDPGIANVKDGTTYKIQNVSLEGTYDPAGDAPTAANLNVVDNQDGSTATATISGGDADARYTVYTTKHGTRDWTNSGFRTGNGDVTLTLSKGDYIACVIGGTVAMSVGQASFFWISNSSVLRSNTRDLTAKAVLDALSGNGTSNAMGVQVTITPPTGDPVTVWASDDNFRQTTQLRDVVTDEFDFELEVPRQTGFPPAAFLVGTFVTHNDITYQLDEVEGNLDLSAVFVLRCGRRGDSHLF